MSSKLAKKVADSLLRGKIVKEGGYHIFINSNDKVELWPPTGDGVEASLFHLEAAVDKFLELSGKKAQEDLGEFVQAEQTGDMPVDVSGLQAGPDDMDLSDGVDDSGKEEFIQAYTEALLWSENMDNLDLSQLPEELSESIVRDASMFWEAAGSLVSENPQQAGHDFALTRNEHGAGFWDSIWPEELGMKLTELSHKFGPFDFEKMFAVRGRKKSSDGEDKDTLPENEQEAILYEAIGDGTNPMPEYLNMAKDTKKSRIVDTFSSEIGWQEEEYRRIKSTPVSESLLKDIADPEAWERRHVSKDIPVWEKVLEREVKKEAGPKIKETWGDYSRDLEAESAQDLYKLVRSLGQEDEYDWSEVTAAPESLDWRNAPGNTTSANPSALGQTPGTEEMNPNLEDTMVPSNIASDTEAALPLALPALALGVGNAVSGISNAVSGISNTLLQDRGAAVKESVDESAKKYWGDYYGDYGKDLTKDDVTKSRVKKDKKDKKDAQMAPPVQAPPKASPGGAPAPGAPAPGGAPGAPPGGAPGGAPAPGAPQKNPESLDPGVGQQGLESLGWSTEEINLMSDEDKKKILQFKVNKPGTKPQAGPPAPDAPAPGGAPAPGAPMGGPKGPPAPGAPAPGVAPMGGPSPSMKAMAARIQENILKRKVQRVLAQMAPNQQAPQAEPQVHAPPAAPPQAPQQEETEFTGSSIDQQALDILSEVRASVMEFQDPEMAPLNKYQAFAQRLSTELGMSVDEFVNRIGINKQQLQKYFE